MNRDVIVEFIEAVASDETEGQTNLVIHAYIDEGNDKFISVQPGDWIIMDGKETFAMDDEEFKEKYESTRGQPTRKKRSTRVYSKPKAAREEVDKICIFKGCDNAFVDTFRNKRKYCELHNTWGKRNTQPKSKICQVCGAKFEDVSPHNNRSKCTNCAPTKTSD